MVRETDVEAYLVSTVESLGGVAEKTISPSGRGFFDRIVVLPGGRTIFVEVKRPKGGRVSIHQRTRHQHYAALGAEVVIVRTFTDVDRLVGRP
jgi:hypothetical protein